MAEHYNKSTIAAQSWCRKCNRNTLHEVHNGRKGACTVCVEQLEFQHEQMKLLKPLADEEQLELFK